MKAVSQDEDHTSWVMELNRMPMNVLNTIYSIIIMHSDSAKRYRQPVFACVFCIYSAISLASKCSTSAFRMHIRAHGTLSKVFSALHDAPDNPVNLQLYCIHSIHICLPTVSNCLFEKFTTNSSQT